MARSPLTETFNRVQGMVFYVQENLSADEYMLFLDMVDPQPDPAPIKKTRKKRTTKSAKAQSLSSVITSSLEAKADAPQVFNGTPCKANVPGLDVECGEPEDYPIHDPTAGYGGYHPFSLTPAEKKSRRKSAAANNTQSTETNSEGALAVGASGD